jgi:hypothetical protein
MFDSSSMNRQAGAPTGPNQQSDMTFFDNKMLANGPNGGGNNLNKRGINSRSAQSRIYAGGV